MKTDKKVIVGRAACDWLTVTSWAELPVTELANRARWREKDDPGPSRWQNYRGVQGEQWFAGVGEQNGLPHWAGWFSGHLADELLPETRNYNDMADPFMTNVTRFDVQITLPAFPLRWSLSRMAERLSQGRLGAWGRRGPKPKVEWIHSATGGTVYIGGRNGGRYARLYEKEVGKERFLRLEYEYKRGLSRQLYDEWRGTDEGVFAAALKGEIDTFPDGLKNCLAPFVEWSEGKLAQRPYAVKEEASEQSKLDWLKKIAPSLHQMSLSPEIGNEVRKILRHCLRPSRQYDTVSRDKAHRMGALSFPATVEDVENVED